MTGMPHNSLENRLCVNNSQIIVREFYLSSWTELASELLMEMFLFFKILCLEDNGDF